VIGVVPKTVPGVSSDITVHLAAPSEVGKYRVYWRLETPSGEQFGPTIWVEIIVKVPSKKLEDMSAEELREQVKALQKENTELKNQQNKKT